MTVSTEERHARYRAGLCTTCGERPHSAGRPRCESCHEIHTNPEKATKP